MDEPADLKPCLNPVLDVPCNTLETLSFHHPAIDESTYDFHLFAEARRKKGVDLIPKRPPKTITSAFAFFDLTKFEKKKIISRHHSLCEHPVAP